MKRALMLAHVSSMIQNFNMSNLHLLQEMGYEVDVACNFDGERGKCFKEMLANMHIRAYQIDFSRSPLPILQNRRAYLQTKKLLTENYYELIHCHSPMGSVLCRLAAIETRKRGTKVIYTAHGFHFYQGAPLLNWLIYYPVEKMVSRWTDLLITINKEDYAFATQHLWAKQVEYIPSVGIDLKKFNENVLNEEERIKKRTELGIGENEFMLLSVGELNVNKNYSFVIKALSKITNIQWRYYICGEGNLEIPLKQLTKELGIQDKIHLLGYRKDVNELNACCDLFIFPSLREGFGLALAEAVATKRAIVCSNIRGPIDFVEKGSLFKLNDIENLKQQIIRHLSEDVSKEINDNYQRLKSFDIEKVNERMKDIYARISVQ